MKPYYYVDKYFRDKFDIRVTEEWGFEKRKPWIYIKIDPAVYRVEKTDIGKEEIPEEVLAARALYILTHSGES